MTPLPRIPSRTSGVSGGSSSSSSSSSSGHGAATLEPTSPGPLWHTHMCQDLYDTPAPAATALPPSSTDLLELPAVRFSPSRPVSALSSAATISAPLVPISRRRSLQRGHGHAGTAWASPALIDSKCPGADVFASLCALPATFAAAPVYAAAHSPRGAPHMHAAAAAAAALTGSFVGLVDTIDCAHFALRALQKLKAASAAHASNLHALTGDDASASLAAFASGGTGAAARSAALHTPAHDHTPLAIHSDASLLVDLSGANPFVPLDVRQPQPIAALVSLFAQGIRRVCYMEASATASLHVARAQFKGLVSQMSLLSFMQARRTDWGDLGAQSMQQLGLITPAQVGRGSSTAAAATAASAAGVLHVPSVDWSDATVVQALQAWLTGHHPHASHVPCLPLTYRGAFVDAFTPSDLRALLASRLRSSFYSSVYELKTRVKQQQHAAEMQLQRERERNQPRGLSTTATNAVPSSASASTSRAPSRSVSRRGSTSHEQTREHASAAFATTSSSSSSSSTLPSSSTLRVPSDGAPRLLPRKKSLNGSEEVDEEVARALRAVSVALHGGGGSLRPVVGPAAASAATTSRPTSRAPSQRGSRDSSPLRSEVFITALSGRPTHSRRSTMPAPINFANLPLNAQAAPAATQQHHQLRPMIPSSPRESMGEGGVVVSPSAARRSHRRFPTSSGVFADPVAPTHGTAANDHSASASSSSFSRRSTFQAAARDVLSPPGGASATATAGESTTEPVPLPVSSSRRGEGSVLSIMHRRGGSELSGGSASSIRGELDDEVHELDQQIEMITSPPPPSSISSSSSSSFSPAAPSSANSSTASLLLSPSSARNRRRLRHATLPTNFTLNVADALMRSGGGAAAEQQFSPRSRASSGSSSAHIASPPPPTLDRPESLGGGGVPVPVPPLSHAHHSVSLMSLLNPHMLVHDTDSFAAVVERMVAHRVPCLWRVEGGGGSGGGGSSGRITGVVTATDLFRCMQQRTPHGGHPPPQMAISQFDVNLSD